MSVPLIETLLSARLCLSPQLVGSRIVFLSDLQGRIGLYTMEKGGSEPQPLIPPEIALQNPALMEGEAFCVLPKLGRILVMIDQDGDENYQPCTIPLDGGLPAPFLGDRFQGQQVHCLRCDAERNVAAFTVEPRTDRNYVSCLVDLESLQVTDFGASPHGNWFAGANEDYTKVALIDSYTMGDTVIFQWEQEAGERRRLYGKPLDQREEAEFVPPTAIDSCYFTSGDRGLFFTTSLFDDRYGLGYLDLSVAENVQPVEIVGTRHTGEGELEDLKHVAGSRYLLKFNIDGCSWVYEGVFDEGALRFDVTHVLCGEGVLSNGVLQSLSYEKASGDFCASYSTATSPTQLYTIEGADRTVVQHTRQRFAVSQHALSSGEDASYTSHDGLRVSARLYLPATELGFSDKRPVIFYIHGGPQGQERPDFSWFSMPLIQLFTMSGFAVFAPNVRGSSGYGLDYMKRVDRDWGGQDRLDHVAAFEQLRRDERLDMERTGVMGRSYGGYMTLTLVGRHPELWKAGCDMFGPYNLLTFVDRIPETWKTYFHLAIGHPEDDRDLLVERSPSTHLAHQACPLLVIQGANDPRVVEIESRDLVEELRAQGKEVEYLVFEDEGHDVLKFENKVRCFDEIVRFFARHLA